MHHSQSIPNHKPDRSDGIDGDNARAVISPQYSFPSQGDPLAFMVMSESKVSGTEELFSAHSGSQGFADFSAAAGAHTNDFMISPKLNLPTSRLSYLSFFAKSAEGNKENFRIAYRKAKSSNAEEETTEILKEEEVRTKEWKLFSYEIPSDASDVMINYTSKDQYAFLLDDTFIGQGINPFVEKQLPQAGTPGGIEEYEVFIDGKSVGRTKEKQHRIEHPTKQKYSVRIVAYFKSGKSAEAEATIDFAEVVSSQHVARPSAMKIYPNPARDHVVAEGVSANTEIRLYSLDGRLLLIDRSNAEGHCRINVSGLARGTYLLTAGDDHTTLIIE